MYVSLPIVKFGHCEKATKFEKISHLFWHLLSSVKTSGNFFHIFVAFSENLNFSKAIRNEKCLFLLGADIDIWFRSVINNPPIDFNVAHDGEFSLNCLIFFTPVVNWVKKTKEYTNCFSLDLCKAILDLKL